MSTKSKSKKIKCPWCGRMLDPHKGRIPRHVQSGGLQCVGIGQPIEFLPKQKDVK